MTMLRPPVFKLQQDPKSRGLRCDQEGLFFDGSALLERDETGQFRAKEQGELRKVFGPMSCESIEFKSRVRSVAVVAKALNAGDLARAMMAAVLMRMPSKDDNKIADKGLEKGGYNPAEPRDEHGQWTNGGITAGELIPAQAIVAEPFFGPMIEELPAEPLTLPRIDVVPPMVMPRTLTREPASNPFRKPRKCAKEWAEAEKFCRDLIKKGRLGADGYRGFGQTYEQCVRGQVSAECGGNPTAFDLEA